jgi:hypothetical protein
MRHPTGLAGRNEDGSAGEGPVSECQSGGRHHPLPHGNLSLGARQRQMRGRPSWYGRDVGREAKRRLLDGRGGQGVTEGRSIEATKHSWYAASDGRPWEGMVGNEGERACGSVEKKEKRGSTTSGR